MRILGLDLDRGRQTAATWLPLGEVTVIAGANDAGKTTMLNAVHDALALAHGKAVATSRDLGMVAPSLVLEVDGDVLSRVMERGCEAVAEGTSRRRFLLAGRTVHLDAALALPSSRILNAEPGRSTWVAFARSQAELDHSRWDPVFAALERSDIVELVPAFAPQDEMSEDLRRWRGEQSDRGEAGWGWEARLCVPVEAARESPMRELVLELLPQADLGSDRPVAVIPAHPGVLSGDALPVPHWLPYDDELVDAMLQRVCRAVSSALGAAAEQAREAELATPTDWPAAELVFGRIVHGVVSIAQQELTPMVSERYTIGATEEAGGWNLHARSVRTAREFPLAHLAQGYRLWAQLALLNACDISALAAEALASGIGAADPELDATIETLLQAVASRPQGAADGCGQLLRELARLWPARRTLSRDPVGESLVGTIAMPRLFVIDEPEQHLHPTLQRRAARWLRDWSRSNGTQCLVATHSPAFLSLGEGALYTRAERAADGLVGLREIDPHTLSAGDEVAAQLGLDRGELLAMWRMVLFVEGATDVAVLEQLFPGRIREIGLLLTPLHGVRGVKAVPVAQLLFRMLRVPFAILVDGDPTGRIASLWDLPTDALRKLAAKDSSDELVAVARMLATAREEDVHVDTFSITGRDILELIDPQDIRNGIELAGQRRAELWPGWSEALELHRRGGSRGRYDEFFADRFGLLKDPALVALCAASAKRHGRVSRELERLMDDLEQTANRSR